MKRGLMLFAIAVLFVSFASASCNLDVTLLNQDPYPAVPGDYVKLVFQVSGIENPECKSISFELIPNYPLILDPSTSTKVEVKGDTYLKSYNTHLQVPYKVRVDANALNGDSPIGVQFSSSVNPNFYILKEFNLSIEDLKASFEVYVKDYDLASNIITFEILNIGESDIQALTVEIEEQKNIEIIGANRNIVGDLDSNDYTTADFEAIANSGELILNLYYTDKIGQRRTSQSNVSFNKSPFEKKFLNQKSSPTWFYIFIIILVLVIIYFIYRKIKKKKQHKLHRN
jgi:hypothetical protein